MRAVYPGGTGIWRCWFLWRVFLLRTWRKKTLGATREPTTNSTHIWHWTGIEPRPHSILRHPCPSPHPPSLLPSKYCYDWWNRPRSIYQYWLAWLRGFRVKIANFSSFFCSSISKRDLDTKKTTPNIEV